MANPISNPMATILEKSLKAADHLRKHDEYGAAIALAKMLAGQIDDAAQSQDPDILNKLNMRVIPNYHKVLFTLGLTPEGFAKITNPAYRPSPGETEDNAPETPKASEEEPGDALDALVTQAENVVKMSDRR